MDNFMLGIMFIWTALYIQVILLNDNKVLVVLLITLAQMKALYEAQILNKFCV